MRHEPDPSLAYGFARCAHLRQIRKYSREPYANCCARAANHVAEYTHDEEIVTAAVVHDVLEDTDVIPDEMASIVGERVTRLVTGVGNVAGLRMEIARNGCGLIANPSPRRHLKGPRSSPRI
ncbi:HD domain-containing protein [Singulisphaera sp. PoT]|uniref:HD domain-containing protein n=1 Tax=Singulisphaera sp. PoT TaxID=3411797 RepID=UPI003BF5617B